MPRLTPEKTENILVFPAKTTKNHDKTGKNTVKPCHETIKNSQIIDKYATNDNYSHNEQVIIDQALAILASKLVNQSPAFEMTSSQKTKTFLQLKLAPSKREIFAVMFLDTAHRVIAYEEVTVGTIDSASVYPREITRRALSLNASAVILSHNHPSATLEASQPDINMTRAIHKTLGLFNINTLDHVIVTEGGTYSFAEHGLMD